MVEVLSFVKCVGNGPWFVIKLDFYFALFLPARNNLFYTRLERFDTY